jgi:type IV secretion/conjugal transfer VirB4 family ATPase
MQLIISYLLLIYRKIEEFFNYASRHGLVFIPMSEYASKSKAFSDYLAQAVRINENTIRDKDGGLLTSFSYMGDDLDSSDRRELHYVSRRVANAVVQLGDGWMYHIHSIRRPALGYPEGSSFSDPTSLFFDEIRRQKFSERGRHFTNVFRIDLKFMPPPDTSSKLKQLTIAGQGVISPKERYNEMLAEHAEKLRRFVGLIKQDLHLEMLGLRVEETEEGFVTFDDQLSHLVECATSKIQPVRAFEPGTDLSAIIACEPAQAGFRVKIGDNFVGSLVVTGVGNESYPGIFDFLNTLDMEYRITWRFIAIESAKAMKSIQLDRNRWYKARRGFVDEFNNKDPKHPNRHALEMSQDADEAENDLRSETAAFGYYTMTIIFWQKIGRLKEEDAWFKLLENVERVVSMLGRNGFTTYFEKENNWEAFLGTQPGNGHAQVRRPMLSSLNLGDYIPTTAIWPGLPYNPAYGEDTPPLMKVSTRGSTPFSLNVHVTDGRVGHFCIVGSTGGGKSVLGGTLLIQHRRYPRSRQIVFDYGRSHYALAMAVGGSSYDIGRDESLQFCPLAHIADGPEELEWATGWILDILRHGAVDVRHRQEDVYKALLLMSRNSPPYSMTNLTMQPFLTNDEKRILRNYTSAGSYPIFDGLKDFSENADFIHYELQGIAEFQPAAKEPLLSYLFHRVQRMCKGRPTMLFLEEVWTFFQDQQAEDQIKTWLRTLRKANVAVGFATQDLSDYTRSALGPIIIGSCKTKFYLANREAATESQAQVYRQFGLTNWQTKMISRLGRFEYFYASSEGRRSFKLELTPMELAFVGISAPDQIGTIIQLISDERRFIAEYGENAPGFIPWQVRWLRTYVPRDDKMDGWVNYYDALWKQKRNRFGPDTPEMREMSHA